MKRWIVAALLVLPMLAGAPTYAAEFKIVTASPRGTYIQIGRDLASIVAPDAHVDLDVLPSAGSAENVRRLRYEPGVRLAIVQSDVLQAFADQAASGKREAASLIRPLRVVMPLYNEEIYFVVRADSALRYVHEIGGSRIAVGELGSGTALTTTTLYRAMFGEPLPDSRATFATNEDALVKLITDRSVDVVAIVAGQPAKILTEMKPEARQYVRLLAVDPTHAATRAAMRTYFPATIRASSYPALLDADIPGFAVKAFLVTYDYDQSRTRATLADFAQSLCRHFDTLQEKGHPKWREVELTLPELPGGWTYYPVTSRVLNACEKARTSASVGAARACTQQERVLGLCP